jgi:NADPH:quinone reductase
MVPKEMTVVLAREAGGPDVLEIGRRPVPEPRPGEVLIRVTAAGVNGPDIVQRKGQYPPPEGASDLLGLEVSGEIVATATAAAAGRWAPGDRVTALTNGAAMPSMSRWMRGTACPCPEGVDEVDAAGLPETYFTVWSNIFHDVKLAENALFLVHGGAGGRAQLRGCPRHGCLEQRLSPAGLSATPMASILSSAPPLPPEMIAPA